MAQSFSQIVTEWTKQTEARLLAVWRRSVEMLAEEMNKTGEGYGELPHRTGRLMNSQQAKINAIIERGPPNAEYSGSDVGAVIAEAILTDDIFIGWQAIYAHRMNYGFVGEDSLGRVYNQAGRHFIERAASMWPQIVARANKEIESSANSR